MNYDGFESLDVQLGSGDDAVTVVNSHSGRTLINSFAGDDSWRIERTTGEVTTQTGSGDDSIQVGASDAPLDGLMGALSIDAGPGHDALRLDDSGQTETQFGELSDGQLIGLGTGGVTFVGVESAEMLLGSGNDTLIVSDLSQTFSLDAGPGDDQIDAATDKRHPQI